MHAETHSVGPSGPPPVPVTNTETEGGTIPFRDVLHSELNTPLSDLRSVDEARHVDVSVLHRKTRDNESSNGSSLLSSVKEWWNGLTTSNKFMTVGWATMGVFELAIGHFPLAALDFAMAYGHARQWFSWCN